MAILDVAKGIGGGVGIVKKLKDDPVGFVLDRIVALVVQLLVPIPGSGEIAVYFKVPIIAMLGTVLILFLFCLTFFVTVIFTPSAIVENVFQTITDALHITTGAQAIPIEALQGYIEAGFSDTAMPARNPFGGSGMTNTIITASFLDSAYFAQFHMIHTGVDLVPTSSYYNTNQAYQKTKRVIMFATHSGKVYSYTDGFGALTVEITNSDNTIKTVYKHLQQIIMASGQDVKAGQPVGVMGSTGFATGEHLHYEVRINDGGNWVAVNPLGYITQ